MNLSNTAEYAIRILTFMAVKNLDIYTAKYLIEQLNISDKYLRKIMTHLTKAGLIRSIQGRDGGYVFNDKPENINLMQIIDSVDDMDKYIGCVLGFKECSDSNPCVLHTQWSIIKNQIFDLFNKTNLLEVSEDMFLKLEKIKF